MRDRHHLNWITPPSPAALRSPLPWVVLVISMACTLSAWNYLHNERADKIQSVFHARAHVIAKSVSERLIDFEHFLRGGAALFTVRGTIDRFAWHAYVQALDLPHSLPDIVAMGYAPLIAHDGPLQGGNSLPRQSNPELPMTRVGGQSLRTPILFIEPFNESNRKILGFDFYSESTRREAILRTLSTGEPTLTHETRLPQDFEKPAAEAGMLLFLPVHARGMRTDSAQARESATRGFVYAAFRVKELIESAIGDLNFSMDVELLDVSDSTSDASSGKLQQGSKQAGSVASLQDLIPVALYGRSWLVSAVARAGFANEFDSARQNYALAGGSLVSALLFLLVWYGASVRRHAMDLAQEMSLAYRSSEARLEGIIGTAQDAIITIDESQMIVLFNAAAEKLFGVSNAEAVGTPLSRLIPARYREQHETHIRRFGLTGETTRSMGSEIALYGLRASGEEFPIEASISRVREGDRHFYTVILRDITLRKQAHDALRQSLRFSEQIMNGVHEGLIVWDRDLRVVEWNRFNEEFTGLTRAAAIGKKLFDLFPTLRAHHVDEYFQRALSGKPTVAEGFYARLRGTTTYLPPTTRMTEIDPPNVAWTLSSFSPHRDHSGNIVGVIHSALDVTELKRAEFRLTETSRLSREILSNTADAIVVYDAELRFVLMNAATCRLNGLQEQDVIGRSVFDVFPQMKERAKYLHAALAGEIAVANQPLGRLSGTVRFLPPGAEDLHARDPGVVWTKSIYSPHRNAHGEIVGVIAVSTDITEEVHSRSVLKSNNERLQQLAAHMENVREAERTRIAQEVHDELGATLTGLKMDLSAARNQIKIDPLKLEQDLDGSMALVDEAVKATRRIINDLRPSILDNLGVWAALEWQALEISRRAGIRCVIELDHATESTRLSESRATAVFRIVQEALSNVLRHAAASEVAIRGSCSDGFVHVEISDDGSGFDAEQLDTEGHWGMMGMRERAQSHGGVLRIVSSLGRGTQVMISMPVEE